MRGTTIEKLYRAAYRTARAGGLKPFFAEEVATRVINRLQEVVEKMAEEETAKIVSRKRVG
jgi:hypothetical protein